MIEEEVLADVLDLMVRLGLFTLSAVVSPYAGRLLLRVLLWIFRLSQYYVGGGRGIQDRFVLPFQNLLTLVFTFVFLAAWLNLLIEFEELYTFLGSIVYLALSVSLILFATRIAQQIIRSFVIVLVQRWFGEVNEVVLVFETLVYVLIVISAILIFAIGLRVNLLAVITSLGIGGVAVAFAAQQALSRLFGTMELYLDRPYVQGEYIRVNFNPYAEDIYGRVEAIGLRSTKIRIVAQNTIMIVPNSLMASKNIENISRGKKVMAMLCLDFIKQLREGEQALVRRVVEEASQVFWGFDRASTRIQFSSSEKNIGTRARIIFFISSSGENSLTLRKRLLELANDALARRLAVHNLRFTAPEPVAYVDSPMSL